MQGGDLLGEMFRKPGDLLLLIVLNRMAQLIKIRLRLSNIILDARAAGTKKLPVKARLQRSMPH